MTEQSRNTEMSLITSQLATIQQQPQQKSLLYTYLVSIILVLIAFYYLAFGLIELITNYLETSYTYDLTCSSRQCSVQTDFLGFQDNRTVFYYLRNPSISQHDISYQMQQINGDLTVCASYQNNQQGLKTTSISGSQLQGSNKMKPCGKFIALFPGQNFQMISATTNKHLEIKHDNLDTLNKSYDPIQNPDQAWATTSSERFKTWNQQQTSQGITKFWGYTNSFQPDIYQIHIKSQNPIKPQIGDNLSIVISDNHSLFGNNISFCIINFLWGTFLFVMGGVSCWQQRKMKLENEQCEDSQFDEQLKIKIVNTVEGIQD